MTAKNNNLLFFDQVSPCARVKENAHTKKNVNATSLLQIEFLIFFFSIFAKKKIANVLGGVVVVSSVSYS